MCVLQSPRQCWEELCPSLKIYASHHSDMSKQHLQFVPATSFMNWKLRSCQLTDRCSARGKMKQTFHPHTRCLSLPPHSYPFLFLLSTIHTHPLHWFTRAGVSLETFGTWFQLPNSCGSKTAAQNGRSYFVTTVKHNVLLERMFQWCRGTTDFLISTVYLPFSNRGIDLLGNLSFLAG